MIQRTRSKPKGRSLSKIPMILALVTLVSASACQQARFAVPLELINKAHEMPCIGRQGFTFNESFSFGSFRVLDVDRSWTKTTGRGHFWFESSQADQNYEFSIVENDGQIWDIQCAVSADVAKLEIETFLGGEFEIEIDSIRSLIGVLANRNGGDAWKLVMGKSSGADLMMGTLRRGNLWIEIDGSRMLSTTPIPISEESGYIFRRHGQILAAVEVINAGAVWIHPSVTSDLRSALAAASAALLLYRDISDN
ncbi:hypothetical protein ACFLT9_02590 [Acidobacteriota bacterium]